MFLQENKSRVKRSTPVEDKESLPQEYIIPQIAGINKLARMFPMPDGDTQVKAENGFMAGCVRFWEWIPGAASCSHRKDSGQRVFQVLPCQVSLPDPTDWNRSLPGMPIISSV